MSAQDRRRYVDTVEGVAVEKRYDDAAFPFPSIVYDIASTREETVAVTVEDVLPAAIDAADVGFHSDYGGDDWRLDGDRLVFERELDPDADCRTIYAVSATETDDPRELFVEPAVIDVSPPVADEETLSLSEPAESDAAEGGHGSASSAAPADDRADPVGALAAQVRDGDPHADDLAAIASAVVDALDDPSGSVDARLSRLEADVAELRAYSDAMAALLDEEAVLDDLPDRLSTLEADLETVRGRTRDLEADLSSLREEAASDADVDALAGSLEDVTAQLGSTDVAGTDAPPVDERLAALEERLQDLETFVDDVRGAFG
jgi:phage shock protein A